MAQLLNSHVLIILFSLVGLLVGYFLEKLILRTLHTYALKTTWKFDDVIIESLKGLISIWFMLIGHSIAANNFHVSDTFTNYSNKISFSLLILSFTFLATRILVRLFSFSTNDNENNLPSTSIILNIIRVIIFLIGFMLILQVFDISITPLLTALGVGGLAVALALQETLSNLFAGIQLIASKKIRNNDFVRLDSGFEGKVVDITWRNTIIKSFQNNMIIVPNSKLSSAIITNFSLPEDEIRVVVEIGVAYDSDLNHVEKVTIETARQLIASNNNCLKGTEPGFRFKAFGDSSIVLVVSVLANNYEDQFLVQHELIKLIHANYKLANIEIPFPMRTVVIKGNRI